MARLNWNQVAAPNFTSSTLALNSANNMLNNAVQGVTTGLDKFKQGRAEMADNAAMAEALKFEDPAAYQKALANGKIAVNPNHMSREGMDWMGNRKGTLLDNQGKVITQEGNQLTNARTKQLTENEAFAQKGVEADRALQEQNAPLIQEYAARVAKGDVNGANEILGLVEGNPELFDTLLNMNQQQQTNKSSLAVNESNMATAKLGRSVTQTNFNNSQADRAKAQQQENAVNQVNAVMLAERQAGSSDEQVAQAGLNKGRELGLSSDLISNAISSTDGLGQNVESIADRELTEQVNKKFTDLIANDASNSQIAESIQNEKNLNIKQKMIEQALATDAGFFSAADVESMPVKDPVLESLNFEIDSTNQRANGGIPGFGQSLLDNTTTQADVINSLSDNTEISRGKITSGYNYISERTNLPPASIKAIIQDGQKRGGWFGLSSDTTLDYKKLDETINKVNGVDLQTAVNNQTQFNNYKVIINQLDSQLNTVTNEIAKLNSVKNKSEFQNERLNQLKTKKEMIQSDISNQKAGIQEELNAIKDILNPIEIEEPKAPYSGRSRN